MIDNCNYLEKMNANKLEMETHLSQFAQKIGQKLGTKLKSIKIVDYIGFNKQSINNLYLLSPNLQKVDINGDLNVLINESFDK